MHNRSAWMGRITWIMVACVSSVVACGAARADVIVVDFEQATSGTFVSVWLERGVEFRSTGGSRLLSFFQVVGGNTGIFEPTAVGVGVPISAELPRRASSVTCTFTLTDEASFFVRGYDVEDNLVASAFEPALPRDPFAFFDLTIEAPEIVRIEFGSQQEFMITDTVSFVTVTDCPADIDANNSVDFVDLLTLLSAWGAPGGAADIDADGDVDFGDLLSLLAAWGPCAFV